MKNLSVFLGLLFLAAFSTIQAQQYTYNHDPMKQNQITVMESGTGSLTPSWYYQSLHQTYQKNAAAKNKNRYRVSAGTELSLQIDYAESIDSALTKRAEIESMNISDRIGGDADLAWATEGSKVTDKMNRFKKNIDRIIPTGGSSEEYNYWLQYYNVYHCAILATQDAYMPNSQRKREYLRIYADVRNKNDLLVKYLVRIHNRKQIGDHLRALVDTCRADKPSATQMALVRWKGAIGMTSGRIIEE